MFVCLAAVAWLLIEEKVGCCCVALCCVVLRCVALCCVVLYSVIELLGCWGRVGCCQRGGGGTFRAKKRQIAGSDTLLGCCCKCFWYLCLYLFLFY